MVVGWVVGLARWWLIGSGGFGEVVVDCSGGFMDLGVVCVVVDVAGGFAWCVGFAWGFGGFAW